MKRSGSAQWTGTLSHGEGRISSESGSISNSSYSFGKRFGTERGTNPDELIAAAHSSCFAMAMAGELEKKNIHADTISVQAIVSVEKAGEGWEIPAVHLKVNAFVPGASAKDVEYAAQMAKIGCPISKLLKANITMDLNISSEEQAALH